MHFWRCCSSRSAHAIITMISTVRESHIAFVAAFLEVETAIRFLGRLILEAFSSGVFRLVMVTAILCCQGESVWELDPISNICLDVEARRVRVVF